jgi:NDT80 / PhoG like DNA-binding  family
MNAQLHGMFFLAESPWSTAGDLSSPPTELTCYRRNLFQVTGNVTLPRGLRYILTDNGEQIPILGQELTISATESVERNPVKIISVPWKTPATSVPVVEDKTEKEPTSIALDLMNGQELDSDFVNFPIAWKRLQFRIATANNGRRKELQQHFIVHLRVMATLATGTKVPLCEVQSGAIIVRGRSPRNFQSRKDFPISGSGSAARKNHSANLPPTRTSTGDSSTHMKQERPSSSAAIDIPQMPFSYDGNDLQVSPDFFEWKIPNGNGGAMTALPDPTAFPAFAQDGNGAYAQSSPDLSRAYPHKPRPSPRAPISLSLTEDEGKKSQSPIEPSKKVARLASVARAPSFSLNLISSPDESADLLYEYFPLGLDDWMPPVDAVYRPHVVHHTNLPADPKGVPTRGRSKRYFSEDQP